MPKLTLYTVLSIFSISLLLYSSCGPKKITPQSELQDSVMAIHDEVMPKMRDIYKLRKGLKKKAKLVPDDSQVNLILESLQSADDAMMDWMASYDAPSEGAKGAMEYLAREKAKIEKVRIEMLSAIENAQKILDAE